MYKNKKLIRKHSKSMKLRGLKEEKIYIEYINDYYLTNKYSAKAQYYLNLIPEEIRTDDKNEATLVLTFSWGGKAGKRLDVVHPVRNKLKKTIVDYSVICEISIMDHAGYNLAAADRRSCAMYREEMLGKTPDILKEKMSYEVLNLPDVFIGSIDEHEIYFSLKKIMERVGVTINPELDTYEAVEYPSLRFTEMIDQLIVRAGDIQKECIFLNYQPEPTKSKGFLIIVILVALISVCVSSGILSIPILSDFELSGGIILSILILAIPLLINVLFSLRENASYVITGRKDFVSEFRKRFKNGDSVLIFYHRFWKVILSLLSIDGNSAVLHSAHQKPYKIQIHDDHIDFNDAANLKILRRTIETFDCVANVSKYKSLFHILDQAQSIITSPNSEEAENIFKEIIAEKFDEPPGVKVLLYDYEKPHMKHSSELSVTYLLLSYFVSFTSKTRLEYYLLQKALIENRHDRLLTEQQVVTVNWQMRKVRKSIIDDIVVLDTDFKPQYREPDIHW